MKSYISRPLPSFLLGLALLMTGCQAAPAFDNSNQSSSEGTAAQSEEIILPDTMEDGSILHAWCWSFDTIRENLPAIAKAGFKSVQTSPINKVVEGENGGMQLQDTDSSSNQGKWYYLYQPVSYDIGNYVLGSEEDLKALCEEADKYGIKIIADAVINHMTSDEDLIEDSVYESGAEPFHNQGQLSNYSDRHDVTQKDLLGLKDLNTQDEAVQKMLKSYLEQAVADGVDGFRYDAAKHIELPDDQEAFASDFWTNILDNGSEFQYGEVLQEGASRQDAYSEIMHVTASDYGKQVRTALATGNLKAKNLENYKSYGVDDDQLVLWVESHDNYCNDESWKTLNEKQTLQGWAIIASRASGTPLFFSRPANADRDNPWGDNELKKRGSDAFMAPEVQAVNQFRTAMIGQDETLSNPMDNNGILLIERGDAGAVIISALDEKTDLKTETKLKDGTYTDRVAGGKFIVKDGELSGTLPEESVVVLYEEPSVPSDQQ